MTAQQTPRLATDAYSRPDLLTVRQAAAAAHCSTDTIRRHISAGHIPSFKYGRDHLIPKDALDTFVNHSSRTKSERIDMLLTQIEELHPSFSMEQQLRLCALV